MRGKEAPVATVEVRRPEVNVETPGNTEYSEHSGKQTKWKRRGVLALAALATVGVGIPITKVVQRERQESKESEQDFERADRQFIREEFTGNRKIQNLVDVVILRAGVEIRENCHTLNSTFLVKPKDNLNMTVPEGKILPVIAPVRVNDNDGTFWYRFSMATIDKNGVPNTSTTFSEAKVADRNICVDVSKYAGKNNAAGEPLIDYKFTKGGDFSYANGTMDSSGVIRAADIPVATGTIFPASGEGFLDSYAGILQLREQMKANPANG